MKKLSQNGFLIQDIGRIETDKYHILLRFYILRQPLQPPWAA